MLVSEVGGRILQPESLAQAHRLEQRRVIIQSFYPQSIEKQRLQNMASLLGRPIIPGRLKTNWMWPIVPINAHETRYYLRTYFKTPNAWMGKLMTRLMSLSNPLILKQDHRVVISQ